MTLLRWDAWGVLTASIWFAACGSPVPADAAETSDGDGASETEDTGDTGACGLAPGVNDFDGLCTAGTVTIRQRSLFDDDACPPAFVLADAGDIDEDGVPDAVFSGGDGLGMYLSSTDALTLLDAADGGPTGVLMPFVRLHDLDGDGHLDMATQRAAAQFRAGNSADGGATAIAWGRGDGSFSGWEHVVYSTDETSLHASTFTLPDGRERLFLVRDTRVAGEPGTPSNLVALDFDPVTREPVETVLMTEVAPVLAIGDMNGDGLADFATLEGNPANPGAGVAMRLGEAGGGFGDPVFGRTSPHEVVTATMANIDGGESQARQSLVVTYLPLEYELTTNVEAWTYDETGTLAFLQRRIVLSASVVTTPMPADLDGDGDMDLWVQGSEPAQGAAFVYVAEPDPDTPGGFDRWDLGPGYLGFCDAMESTVFCPVLATRLDFEPSCGG